MRKTEHMRNAMQAHLAFGTDADALLAAANCKESSTWAPLEAQSSKPQSGEHLQTVVNVTYKVAFVLQVPAVMYIARCLVLILHKTGRERHVKCKMSSTDKTLQSHQFRLPGSAILPPHICRAVMRARSKAAVPVPIYS